MEKVLDLSQLVKKAQKDPQAFAQLYTQTFSFSYAVAKRYLNNPQDIEDVLQTSYLYASKSLSSLRNPEYFQSWMQTILVHECQKCLRTKRKISDLLQRSEEIVLSRDERYAWTDLLEQHEKYDAVRRIVDSLPDEQKMCAALFYYDEKTVAEIAEMLDVPEGTVKSRLYHVRQKIGKELKKLSKQDDSFLGMAPVPVLCSFFNHAEKELAAASLRDSVWKAILSPQTVSRGARHFLRFSATSSGVRAATVVRATAIAVSTAAVVGSGVAVRENIREIPAWDAESVTAAVDVCTTDGQALPTEMSGTQPASESASGTHAPQTSRGTAAPAASSAERAHAKQESVSGFTAKTNTSGTTQRSSTTALHAAQTAASPTTVSPTAAAPSSAAPSTAGEPPTTAPTTAAPTVHTTAATTATTQPAAATTAAAATTTKAATTATTTTTTTTTQPPPTSAAEPSAYQMTGGVLRRYSGSESHVSIPSTVDGQAVTAIGSGAFESNQTLRTVQIPNTVTRIGQEAFSDCISLQSVSLPSSLTSIGIGAFDGCTSLDSVSVPSGTTSIDDDAFCGCTSLRSVTIPPSVQSFGDNVFDGCDVLTIHCAENSAAHTYAKENGISYQLTGGI